MTQSPFLGLFCDEARLGVHMPSPRLMKPDPTPSFLPHFLLQATPLRFPGLITSYAQRRHCAYLHQELALDAFPLLRRSSQCLVSREEARLELEEAEGGFGRVGHCELPLAISAMMCRDFRTVSSTRDLRDPYWRGYIAPLHTCLHIEEGGRSLKLSALAREPPGPAVRQSLLELTFEMPLIDGGLHTALSLPLHD